MAAADLCEQRRLRPLDLRGGRVTKRRVSLVLHFDSMLDDNAGVFEASDAKFVRRIAFESASEIDDAVVGDLVGQAVTALPEFKDLWRDLRRAR
jgi:hypothetical protein